MATQYTLARETNLVNRGYKVIGINLDQEVVERLRDLYFVTEMKYTTEQRGVPEYKIWVRPKGELIAHNIFYGEVDYRGQDLYGEWNIERSKVAVERNTVDPTATYFVVKTSNGYAWRIV